MVYTEFGVFTMKMIPIIKNYFDDNNELHNAILCDDDFSINESMDEHQVRLLLQQKAWGNTPLLLACKTANFEAAKKLISLHTEYKIDVNAQDDRNMSALHWACFYKDETVIQQLLEAGAKTDIQNNYYQTASVLYQLNLKNTTRIRTVETGETSSIEELLTGVKRLPSIAEKKVEFVGSLTGCTDVLFHLLNIASNLLDSKDSVKEGNDSNVEFNSTSELYKKTFIDYFPKLITFIQQKETSHKTLKALEVSHGAELTEKEIKLIQT